MIVAGIFFKNSIQERIIEQLLNLPKTLRPTSYSSNENLRAQANRLSDYAEFEKFLGDNPVGFFLVGDKVRYDVTLSNVGQCSVFAELSDSSICQILPEYIKSFSNDGISFGFACENAEYLHRNLHYFKSGFGDVETWVGRDLDKFIPGLYWLTYVSSDLAKLHGFDAANVSEAADDVTALDEGTMFQFYSDPNDWMEHVRRMDDLCAASKGIFSIEAVNDEVSTEMGFVELDAALAKWT